MLTQQGEQRNVPWSQEMCSMEPQFLPVPFVTAAQCWRGVSAGLLGSFPGLKEGQEEQA